MASSSSTSSSSIPSSSQSSTMFNNSGEKSILTLVPTQAKSNSDHNYETSKPLNKNVNISSFNKTVLAHKQNLNQMFSNNDIQPGGDLTAVKLDKSSKSASTSHVASSMSLPVLTPSQNTNPTSNIISLVTLKSPQSHQKIFPWNSENSSNSTNPGSPSSNSGSPPLALNNVKQYQINEQNPKILRQQVMLGNNNRINFAHMNRPANDSVHVVLKKSSNQTIVIVSKPQSQIVSSNSTSPVFNSNTTIEESKSDLKTSQQKTGDSLNQQMNVVTNSTVQIPQTKTNTSFNRNSANTNNIVLQKPSKHHGSSLKINNLLMSQKLIAKNGQNNIDHNQKIEGKPQNYQKNVTINRLISNNPNPSKNYLKSAIVSNAISENLKFPRDQFIESNSLINETIKTEPQIASLSSQPITLLPINFQSNDRVLSEQAVLSNSSMSDSSNIIALVPMPYQCTDNGPHHIINGDNYIQQETVVTTKEHFGESINEILVSNEPDVSEASGKMNELLTSKEKKLDESKPKPKTKLFSGDVTRCVCGMEHDDGFMICCDKCLVWQHIVCMQIDKKKIPEKFYCEKCEPREINVHRAKSKQKRYLKRQSKKTNDNDNSNKEDKKHIDIENEGSSDSDSNNSSESDSITEEEINIETIKNNDDSKLNFDTQMKQSYENMNKNEYENLNKSIVKVDNESLNVSRSELTNNKTDKDCLQKDHNKKTVKTSNNKKINQIVEDKENGIQDPILQGFLKNTRSFTRTKAMNDTNTENENSNNLTRNSSIENNENSNDSTSTSFTFVRKNCVNDKSNFKKATRNQYSKLLIALQDKINTAYIKSEDLNSTSSSSVPSSSSSNIKKSNISSLLIASDSSNTLSEIDHLSARYQVDKRGILKHLFEIDCMKCIKGPDATVQNQSLPKGVKSVQTISQDQLIGEYCGNVMLESEYKNEENNPYQISYDLDLKDSDQDISDKQTIHIDSSQIGNITRFIRKSCQANCKLKHIFDTNGDLHFIIAASETIAKGNELTLPFDLSYKSNEVKGINSDINLSNCVCTCQRKKCFLRSVLTRSMKKEAKKSDVDSTPMSPILNPVSKKKSNQQLDNENEAKKPTNLKIETKNLVMNEPVDVKKKSPGVSKRQNQHEPDELNKSLSREDRKLMSYLRVFERLEKQGERKKELRQQKAEQKAAKAAAAAAKAAEEAVEGKFENDKENENANQLNNDEKKAENIESCNQQNDKEIQSIIEGGAKNSNTFSEQETHVEKRTTNENLASFDLSEKKVKSPDFSFVDISIRPRETLNLIQRNLSSPSYSMQALEMSNIVHTEQLPMDDSQKKFIQKETKVINPKKRWLKCSEANTLDSSAFSPSHFNENSNTKLASISNTSFSQPPKKRKHIFNEADLNAQDDNDLNSETNSQSSFNQVKHNLNDSTDTLNDSISSGVNYQINLASDLPTKRSPNSSTPLVSTPASMSYFGYYPKTDLHTRSVPVQLSPQMQLSNFIADQRGYFEQASTINQSILNSICYFQQEQTSHGLNIEKLPICVPSTIATYPSVESKCSNESLDQSAIISTPGTDIKKAKKVSLSEYLQRRKTEKANKKFLDSDGNVQTRDNSIESISSSVETTEKSESVTDKLESISDKIVQNEPLKEELSLEKVESGKSKVNKVLTELMATNNKQGVGLNKSFDLFEKRSAFNSMSSSINSFHPGEALVKSCLQNESSKCEKKEPKTKLIEEKAELSIDLNLTVESVADSSLNLEEGSVKQHQDNIDLLNNTPLTSEILDSSMLFSSSMISFNENENVQIEENFEKDNENLNVSSEDFSTNDKAHDKKLDSLYDKQSIITKNESKRDSRSTSVNSCNSDISSHKSRKTMLSRSPATNPSRSVSNSTSVSSNPESLNSSNSLSTSHSRSSSLKKSDKYSFKKIREKHRRHEKSKKREKSHRHAHRSNKNDAELPEYALEKSRKTLNISSSSQSSLSSSSNEPGQIHEKTTKKHKYSHHMKRSGLQNEYPRHSRRSRSRFRDNSHKLKLENFDKSYCRYNRRSPSHDYISNQEFDQGSKIQMNINESKRKKINTSDDEAFSKSRRFNTSKNEIPDIFERHQFQFNSRHDHRFSQSNKGKTYRNYEDASDHRQISEYQRDRYRPSNQMQMMRIRNRSKDREGNFNNNEQPMFSSKFYHSKQVYSRQNDDYAYHHYLPGGRSADIYRAPNRSSYSSKYFDSNKHRMTTTKFDLRHQLSKNYSQQQYQEIHESQKSSTSLSSSNQVYDVERSFKSNLYDEKPGSEINDSTMVKKLQNRENSPNSQLTKKNQSKKYND